MRNRSLFHINRLTPVVLFVALIVSLVQVRPASAAGIVVNASADNYNPADGKCTLREAIDAANLNVASGPAPGECAAGSTTGIDTIAFADNYIITVGSGGALLSQLPYITTPIVISGRGAGNTIIQAAATPDTAAWRVFQVTPNGNLTLDGMTVRYGQCNGSCTVEGGIEPNAGGGIYNNGTLTVTNSVITENTGTFGGGIYNNGGTVTVSNSTISDNNSSQVQIVSNGGGGIYNSGTLAVTNSTISGNKAGGGGGIVNSGTMIVMSSTFSSNDAGSGGGISNSAILTVMSSTFLSNQANSGGGIANGGTVTVANSTFAENTSANGGGIINGGTLIVTNSTIFHNHAGLGGGGIHLGSQGSTELRNTIMANNTRSQGSQLIDGNCARSSQFAQLPINGGNNLDTGVTCEFGSNNGSMSSTDPFLSAPAYNGGPTLTMALWSGSPAVDHGNPSFCSASPVNGRDQRGVLRPLGGGCDIGAFETSAAPGPDTVGVFRPGNGFLFLKHVNLTGFADLSLNYGLGGDYPVVGDWDGNGTDTIGVYRNGTFFLRNSNTLGFADLNFAFGAPGDQPVAGDWNGDGIDTIGLYRPSNGQFFLRNTNSTGAPDLTFFLGNPGDVGIAGDWNGDGIDTTGVFRPSNGFLFLKNINSTGIADVSLNYGLAGDKPVTGDWNFDGVDTIGVLRGNIFFLRNLNTNGFADMSFALGNPGDMPIAGNWDAQP